MSLINQMLKDLDKRRRQGEPSAEKGIPSGVAQLSQPVNMSAENSRLPTKLHTILKRCIWFLLLIAGIWLGMMGWYYWQKWQVQKTASMQNTPASSLAAKQTDKSMLDSLKDKATALFDQDAAVTKKTDQEIKTSHQHLHHLIQQAETSKTAEASGPDLIANTHKMIDSVQAKKPAAPEPVKLQGLQIKAHTGRVELAINLSSEPVYSIMESADKSEITIELEHTHLSPDYQKADQLLMPIMGMRAANKADNLLLTIAMAPDTQVSDILSNTANGAQLLLEFSDVAPTHKGMSLVAAQQQAQAQNATQQQPVDNNYAQRKKADDSDNLNATSNIKKVQHTSPVEEAKRLYARALDMAKRHDISGATTMLTKILKDMPEFNNARETLAAIYIEKKQYQKANSVLQEGISIAPGYPPFISLQARILALQRKPEQAIKLLQTTSPAIAEYPDYYAFLAALYQQHGDYLISAKLYEELIEIQPNNGLWWLGKAIGLNANGQRDLALKAYQRASTTANLTPQLRAYVEQQITKLQ